MSKACQVRIIGGIHRGRRLKFPNIPGLRPTGDRMRETLFNWLQPVIHGARCLDLFAGSGVLGLEAASRGASSVVMLDIDSKVTTQLRSHIQTLGLLQVNIFQADALAWLQQPAVSFDIVFLDPPFASNLLVEACQLLLQKAWLSTNALLYLEQETTSAAEIFIPESLTIMRERRMGRVWCGLAQNPNT